MLLAAFFVSLASTFSILVPRTWQPRQKGIKGNVPAHQKSSYTQTIYILIACFPPINFSPALHLGDGRALQ